MLWYIKYMIGFSKKRLLITLVLSIVVWLVTAVVQAYSTFAKYIGTFSSGCQITGYPLDLCEMSQDVPALIVILTNIAFWFLIINLFFGWFSKTKSSK